METSKSITFKTSPSKRLTQNYTMLLLYLSPSLTKNHGGHCKSSWEWPRKVIRVGGIAIIEVLCVGAGVILEMNNAWRTEKTSLYPLHHLPPQRSPDWHLQSCHQFTDTHNRIVANSHITCPTAVVSGANTIEIFKVHGICIIEPREQKIVYEIKPITKVFLVHALWLFE